MEIAKESFRAAMAKAGLDLEKRMAPLLERPPLETLWINVVTDEAMPLGQIDIRQYGVTVGRIVNIAVDGADNA